MSVKSLEEWVEKLGKTEMPVLANVVQELNELTGDDDTEINQLADAILKDANLTSQVLRIANSVTYNPSNYPINTVSRAIVLVGFKGVRAICISVMIIDSLLKKQPRERLLSQMAQSFHCAVQARSLVRKTRKIAEQAAEEAASVALAFGAPQLCPLIPSRRREALANGVDEPVAKPRPEPMRADPQLQFSILRDLTNAMLENLDVNAVFQMVLEGLHRGIGLERVVLAFVQNQRVQAKFVLGEGTDCWRSSFDFSCAASENNLFAQVVRGSESRFYSSVDLEREKHLVDGAMRKVIDCCSAFVSGVHLGKRCVAVFYADRGESGEELREEQFQSFRHFMIQTEMCLKMISERRAR